LNWNLTMDKTAAPIFDLDYWENQLALGEFNYQHEQPYPYIILDNFLPNTSAKTAMAAFPAVKDEGWIHYLHVNEKKHGLNKFDLMPPYIREVIQTLNHPDTVDFISRLTGIPNLLADDSLEGGGLHQTCRGGFLNVHADFTVHPHKRHWRRRVNLLLYLNEKWEESYNGHLELWSRDMARCEKKIAPLFNRCVIFNTDEDSYHGVPETILCPEDMTRKSIALYYFTEEKEAPVLRSTNYKARPGDGLKAIPIWIDKQLIAVYTSLKRRLGLNDDTISKFLNRFNRKK